MLHAPPYLFGWSHGPSIYWTCPSYLWDFFSASLLRIGSYVTFIRVDDNLWSRGGTYLAEHPCPGFNGVMYVYFLCWASFNLACDPLVLEDRSASGAMMSEWRGTAVRCKGVTDAIVTGAMPRPSNCVTGEVGGSTTEVMPGPRICVTGEVGGSATEVMPRPRICICVTGLEGSGIWGWAGGLFVGIVFVGMAYKSGTTSSTW
jgi:hypothetical protein